MVSLLQDQARTLSRYGMKKHLRILPMYSGLPYADQMKVFERAPSSVRKVAVLLFLYCLHHTAASVCVCGKENLDRVESAKPAGLLI